MTGLKSATMKTAAGSDGPTNAVAEPCRTCGARPLGVCAELQAPELGRMAQASARACARAGDTLFHEGDDNPFVFNIIEGALKLYRLLPDGRRQITGFLFRGDFLGLGARGPATFTAQALTPINTCRFHRADFNQVLHEMPKLERRLVEMAGDELLAAQEQILLLGRKTARERLASFLVRAAERQARLGEPTDRVRLPMTRLDIADYLGLTIETVSRTMTQFRTSGLIRLMEIDELVILDPEALGALAEGAA